MSLRSVEDMVRDGVRMRPENIGIVAFSLYCTSLAQRAMARNQWKLAGRIIDIHIKAIQLHKDKPWYDQAEVP
jgi:hypothetical protein